MKTLMLLSSLVIAFVSSASAARIQGKVVGVKAGNALEILSQGRHYGVKLHGIGCPARNESFGKASRRFVADLVFMADVTLEITAAESDGSFLGKVVLADGKDLGAEMIKSGMAWWNAQANPEESGLARLEKNARETYAGLWATPEDQNDTDWGREILAQRDLAGKGVAGLVSSNDNN